MMLVGKSSQLQNLLIFFGWCVRRNPLEISPLRQSLQTFGIFEMVVLRLNFGSMAEERRQGDTGAVNRTVKCTGESDDKNV